MRLSIYVDCALFVLFLYWALIWVNFLQAPLRAKVISLPYWGGFNIWAMSCLNLFPFFLEECGVSAITDSSAISLMLVLLYLFFSVVGVGSYGY